MSKKSGGWLIFCDSWTVWTLAMFSRSKLSSRQLCTRPPCRSAASVDGLMIKGIHLDVRDASTPNFASTAPNRAISTAVDGPIDRVDTSGDNVIGGIISIPGITRVQRSPLELTSHDSRVRSYNANTNSMCATVGRCRVLSPCIRVEEFP